MSTADDREFISKMKIVGAVVGAIGSAIGGVFIKKNKDKKKKDKDEDK
jgi:hypothetical protein